MENELKITDETALNKPVVSVSLHDRLEECLAKYWYDTEYSKIDMTDHKSAEESRIKFRKWINENVPLFAKQ